MLKVIENIISQDDINQIVSVLNNTDWQDGKLTAGDEAINVKNNAQLSMQHPRYQELANHCTTALQQHLLFVSAAIPKTVLPPIFSSYQDGQQYGNHVDNAIHMHANNHNLVRTDLSLTLFLNDPDNYQGGELIIEDHYGEHKIKLNAGDAILYPSTSLHRVAPVTEGTRFAMVTWIQSMVRGADQRQILHELDMSQTLLRHKLNSNPEIIKHVKEELQTLTHVYHNLIRQWAEV